MPRYSAQTWATLRALYESGKFTSIEQLHTWADKSLKCAVPKMVSIRDKCTEEQWDKSAGEKRVAEQIEKDTTELFAQEGMPPVEAVRLCINGMHTADRVVDQVAERMLDMATSGDGDGQGGSVNLDDPELGDASEVGDDGEKIEAALSVAAALEGLRSVAQAYGVAHKYLQEYCKMTGTYKPVKKDVSGTVHVTQDKANDEAYRRRMRSLGAGATGE